MWKLIIAQKRKSEYTENMITESIELVGNDINELSMLIVRLSKHENGVDTTYKLERVGTSNE